MGAGTGDLNKMGAAQQQQAMAMQMAAMQQGQPPAEGMA